MVYFVKNIIKVEENKFTGDVYSLDKETKESALIGNKEVKFKNECSCWTFVKEDGKKENLYRYEPDTVFLCTKCNTLYGRNGGDIVDSFHYCKDCLDTCSSCGCFELKDDIVEIEGKKLCRTCFEDKYAKCENCGKYELKSKMNLENDTRKMYCQDCVSEVLIVCNHCSGLYLPSGMTTDEEIVDEYGSICRHCAERINREVIKGYHDRPNLKFHGDGKKFFGLELEIGGGGCENDKAKEIRKILGKDHVFFNTDSSINNGFEIISHPHTYEELNKLDWESACKKIQEMGYKDNDKSCGVHVHISRDAFGTTSTERDLNYAKILYFFEKYWTKILKFSRRTEQEVERWASRYGFDVPNKIFDKAMEAPRYRCVNLNNPHTIEFRVFNGTTDANEIRAIIEFCELLTTNVKTLNVNKLPITKFTRFLKGMSDNLKNILEERGCLSKKVEEQEITFDELYTSEYCGITIDNDTIIACVGDKKISLTREEFLLTYGNKGFEKILKSIISKERLKMAKSVTTLTIREDIVDFNNKYYRECKTNYGSNWWINQYAGKEITVNVDFTTMAKYGEENILCFKCNDLDFVLTELMFEETYKAIEYKGEGK